MKIFVNVLIVQLLAFSLSSINFVYAMPVTHCAKLDSPIHYTLQNDIITSSSCVIVNSDNLSLDCQFHKLISGGFGSGISLNNKSNVNISNCIIKNFEKGIALKDSSLFLNASSISGNKIGIFSDGNSSLNTNLNSLENNAVNVQNNNSLVTIAALNNWFGSGMPANISSYIVGNVDFAHFLDFDSFSDDDDDRVSLLKDNCPIDYNPFQEDFDRDGKGDICDLKILINGLEFDPSKENVTIGRFLLTNVSTGYYIVQLKNIEERLETAEELGGTIAGIIPQNLYLIQTTKTKQQIQNNSNIRWVDIYQPAFKFSPDIYPRVAANNLSRDVDSFQVEFFNTTKDAVVQSLQKLGASIKYDFENTLTFDIVEANIINVSFIPEVFLVSPFKEPIDKNDLARAITKVNSIHSGLFGTAFTGAGELVDILDSGLDNGVSCMGIANCNTANPSIHPDFRGRILELRRTTGPGNAIDSTSGHGTHVAGTAVGSGIQSAGLYRGTAPGAQFMMQQRTGNEPAGMNYAIGQNYKIHSNSWGGIECMFRYLAPAKTFDTIGYNNVNSIIVFAAGNEEGTPVPNGCGPATGQNSIQPQSVAKNILAVGATENSRNGNNPNDIATFSSRGPNSNPANANTVRIKPDIVAPGTNIISTNVNPTLLPPAGNVCTSGWGAVDNNYTLCGGTSMATPHVSGSLAVTLEYLRVVQHYTNASGALLKALVINGAVDIGGLGSAAQGTATHAPNNDQGWGRLDLANTLYPYGRSTTLAFLDQDASKITATNTKVKYDKMNGLPLRFSSSTNVTITLVWMDAPPAGLSHALINDLDLLVSTPNGSIYRGNILDPNGFSVDTNTKPGRDAVNNVERVKLINPEDGLYILNVSGARISGSAQPFAVVVSPVVGVDAVNSTGNYTYDFLWNYASDGHTRIYAKSVGLPADKDVHVYIIPYDDKRDWKSGVSNLAAKDITGSVNIIHTDMSGSFDRQFLWDTTTRDKKEIEKEKGAYNIVVDVNNNDKYEPSVDLVDYTQKPGFTVNLRFCHQVDSDTDLWGGSSRGPTPDNRLKPDVVAPSVGRFILKSRQADDTIDKKYVWTTVNDNRYNFDRNNPGKQAYRVSYGTSFAAPAAASVTALIREFYQKAHSINPTGALLKATVVNGAVDMPDRNFGANLVTKYSQTGPIPNFREGWGRINFSKSIMPCGDYKCAYFDQSSFLKKKNEIDYLRRFNKDTTLEITMAWTDPPNSGLTQKQLLSDLELRMISPNSKKYISSFNNFNSNGESVPTTQTGLCRTVYIDKGKTDNNFVGDGIPDDASKEMHVNCNDAEQIKSNVKKLILKNPQDGFWNISVIGKIVDKLAGPNGQKYAIVITGIRGVDSENSAGKLAYNFGTGENIFAQAVGLPNATDVDVYVISDEGFKYDAEKAFSSLGGDKSERNSPLKVKTDQLGGINEKVWQTSKSIDQIISSFPVNKGNYHMVIDIDRDGKFTPGKDVVDYHDKAGFNVKCGNAENGHTCGVVDSSKSTGDIENNFNKGDTAYAKFKVLSVDSNRVSKLYAVRFDTLTDGGVMVDITNNGPDSVTVPKGVVITAVKSIWAPELVGGDYDLVLDIDGNGKFNSTIDVKDPDGFSVLGEVSQVRFAIDSNDILHAVGLQIGRSGKLLYGYSDLKSFRVDRKHPENFDWSKDNSIIWKVVRERDRFTYGSPDITVDSGGNPFLITTYHSGELNWLIFFALNGTTGNLKLDFGKGPSNGGSAVDTLLYFWDDFWDPTITDPRIAIDPNTDLPIISARVFLTFPDAFYFTQIYPLVFTRLSPIITPMPLVPIFYYNEVVSGGAAFYGDSLQVATFTNGEAGGHGSIKWPQFWDRHVDPITGKESDTGRYFGFVFNDVNSALFDVATASPRQGEWRWMPVDEIKGLGSFLGNGDLAVDNKGTIHVAYYRRESRDAPSSSNPKLFYSKIENIKDNSTGIPKSFIPKFTVPTKVSDDVVGGYLNFPSIDVDKSGRASIAWQAGNKLKYTRIDGTLVAGSAASTIPENNLAVTEIITKDIAVIKDTTNSVRPDVVVDSLGRPTILFRDLDSSAKRALYLVKSNSTGGSIDFGTPTEILHTADYSIDPQIRDNTLEINTYSNSFFDETFVGWVEVNANERVFTYKKTIPHLTFLIVIDGLDSKTFDQQLAAGKLPNIKKLLKDNPLSLSSSAVTGFPETTFSTYASIMTGLLPKNHKVPGDKFKDSSLAKNFLASPNDVNGYLATKNVKTIFDYLKENGKTSAAVASIFSKGIGPDQPNKIEPAAVNFNSGGIGNFNSLLNYIDSFNNRDATLNNDAANFISIYLLSHDHGINTNPGDIDYSTADGNFGLIIGKLKKKNILDSSVFIITSDHGFMDVEKSGNNAISVAKTPSKTFGLEVNGQIAYNYVTSSTVPNQIMEDAFEMENMESNPSSTIYNKIESIYIKEGGTYMGFSGGHLYAANDPIKNLYSDASGDIILVAKPDFYFAPQPKESVESSGTFSPMVPLIITGKFLETLINVTPGKPSGLKVTDVMKTAAYLVGGSGIANGISVDGKNLFDPALHIFVGSPVNLHLFDSSGNHVGPMPDGSIETGIPLAEYDYDNRSRQTEINLFDAPDKYRILVEAYDFGHFTLRIEKHTENDSFSISYPTINITNASKAIVDMISSGSPDMMFDYDGDGTFEESVVPLSDNKLIFGENNITVIFNAKEQSRFNIDLSNEIGVKIQGTALLEIKGGEITIAKIHNALTELPAFFHTALQITSNLDQVQNDNLTLEISYGEQDAGFLKEDSLRMYLNDPSNGTNGTQVDLNQISAIHDSLQNKFSDIHGVGTFIIGGTDEVPRINSISINPQVTKIAGDNISILVNATDNDKIATVVLDFLNSSYNLSINSITGLYGLSLNSPSIDGTYPIFISVTDNNSNTVTAGPDYIFIDTTAPNITILNPSLNETIKNPILDVRFSASENLVNATFALDNATLEAGDLSGFTLNVSFGRHSLRIYANDFAGNSGTSSVDFEMPEHNIELKDIDMPFAAKPTDEVEIVFTLNNTGNHTENATVELLADGLLLSNQSITLAAQESRISKFEYNPVIGLHNITINALPVKMENFLKDNTIKKTIFVSNNTVALLVNDAGQNLSSIYEDSIRSAGLDVLTVRTENINLTDRFLEDFRVVIWFTGGSSNTLDGNERDILDDFAANGGSLFLTGENIGEDISATPFFSEILHSRFIRKSPGFDNMAGIPNDPIGRGLLLGISESSEEISPLDSKSLDIFTYIGDGTNSLRINTSDGKIVYFAFGFENIIGDENKKLVMKRIIDYFDADVIPPGIIDMSPKSGQRLEINTTNATLTFLTDEFAQCRISDSFGVRFNVMDVFDLTNGTSHSAGISGLNNGISTEKFVKCRDRSRNTFSFAFTLYVNNRTFFPPVIRPIGEISADENSTIVVAINATDPENDFLNYSVVDVLSINFPKPIAPRFYAANNTMTLHADFNDAGRYRLRAIANDGFSAADLEFTLNIANVNRKPQLQDIAAINAVEDSFFNMSVAAFDPDFDQLSFYDDTGLFNINLFTGTIGFTPRKSDVGIHNVTISVTDGELNDSKPVSIHISPTNHPPSLEFLNPQFATRGFAFTLQVNASDSENDVLTFYDNSSLFNISQEGLINFTPVFTDVGTHFFRITAGDGILNASKILNLVIQSDNRAPVIRNITRQITALQNQSVNISISACDPDLDELCT